MNKKGFTLVELLVVIAIIALLSTLSVVALNSARQKSRDAKRKSDIRQIRTALEMYFDHQEPGNKYPSAPTGNILGGPNAKCLDKGGFKASDCADPIFMQNIPVDPLSGQNYLYTEVSSGTSYSIDYYVEAEKATTTANPSTISTAGY